MFLKGEGLDKINCIKIINDRANSKAIKESNSIGSIVDGDISENSTFTNLNQCRDEKYFNKGNKFYNYNKAFTGLLNDNGKHLACAKMATYEGVGGERGYTCQSILDQRAGCTLTDKEHDLLSSAEIEKLLDLASRRQNAIDDLTIQNTSINNSEESEKQNKISTALRRYTSKIVDVGEFKYQDRVVIDSSSLSDSNRVGDLNDVELFIAKLETELTQILAVIEENRVLLSVGTSQVQFRSKDVCQEVLFDKFKSCMGDESSYDLSPDKISDVAFIKAIKLNLNNNLKSKQDSILTFDLSNSLTKCSKNTACGESGKDNLISARLENSFYNQFYQCNSMKNVIGVVDQEKGDDSVVGDYYESFDRRFKCTNPSPWTMDYHSCKAAVTFYDGAALGDVAMNATNTAIVASRNNQIQKDALNDSVNGGDQLNVGLNAQAKSLTAREQAETRKAVFSGTKVTALTTILLSYKSSGMFQKDCLDGQDELAGGDIHFCVAAEVGRKDAPNAKEIFANQQVRKDMWAEVAKASVETTLAIMAATQASKQRSDVNKYKKMFEEQKDESKIESPEVGLDYCKYNPAAPQCKQRGPRVSNGGEFGYGNVGLQGQGQNLAITDKDDVFGEYNDDVIADGSSDAIDDLGNLIDSDSADSFSNDFNAPGAGEATKGTAIGSGGGGGGAPGGGGGGGSAPAKAKAGQAKYAVTSKAGDYGKRGGSVKYSGGGSAKSKKDASNPFSKMFGSKSSRNIASDVKDIAPAHSGLFDKISKRYERVATDKRLLDLSNVKK